MHLFIISFFAFSFIRHHISISVVSDVRVSVTTTANIFTTLLNIHIFRTINLQNERKNRETIADVMFSGSTFWLFAWFVGCAWHEIISKERKLVRVIIDTVTTQNINADNNTISVLYQDNSNYPAQQDGLKLK